MAQVLMVEDDATLLSTYTRLLTRAGHTVVGVGLASEMRTALAGTPFDVVVTDLALPDSPDPGRHIAEIGRLAPGVSILVLTGHPSVDSAVVAVEQRVFRYLVKPVDIDVLVAAVQAAADANANPLLFRRKLDEAMKQVWFAWQPIVDRERSVTYGWEALVRGRMPGFTRPDQLLEAAVRSNALLEFGRVCRERIAARLPEIPPGELAFINLHPSDLADPELYDTGAPLSRFASRLVLELTERSSLDEIPDIDERIAQLRGLGFQIAIDDLGAGYSGLTAVARLRPDIVKVDMALVRNIHTSPAQRAVVRSIGELCRELDIRLVGEGVEILEERDVLSALGLNLQQGYLYGKPDERITAPRFPRASVTESP
jgi:EAL domain-containing protein (putative c-di-GMP-specific phosphodiesterase class I)/CheY-like chemotaxis protein